MSASIYHGGGPASWGLTKEKSSEETEKRANDLARNSEKKGKVLTPPEGSGWDHKPRMNHARLCQLFDALPQEQQQQVETLLESSPQEWARVLNLLSAHFAQKAQATPLETIAANYKPYKSCKFNSDAILKHLKAQLGEHLVYFGAPVNAIYLNQLRKIEPQINKMDDRLKYERRRNDDDNVPRLSDIVPKLAERNKIETAALPDQAGKELMRIGAAKKYRTAKKHSPQAVNE